MFDFIVKLIGQAKRRPGAVSMEGLHHCLNRTILFLLSRTTDSIADQMAVLEALHKLTTHRYCITLCHHVSSEATKKNKSTVFLQITSIRCWQSRIGVYRLPDVLLVTIDSRYKDHAGHQHENDMAR